MIGLYSVRYGLDYRASGGNCVIRCGEAEIALRESVFIYGWKRMVLRGVLGKRERVMSIVISRMIVIESGFLLYAFIKRDILCVCVCV